jgi:riboflavin kinase/FMN adenylyltransferase
MRVIRDLSQASVERETVLTIGAFDGLHLGHQSLLRRLMRSAQEANRLSGVVTFDPPPRMVLAPDSNLICLTTTEDKIELLQAWGLDLLVIVPFTLEVARTSARDFVWPLRDRLRMAELWVGWNFALGRGREGDAPALTKLGQEMGFVVRVVKPVREGGAAISSTQIRNLLGAGRVREVAEMLGRYYQIGGRVVPGVGQERHVGYPTANLNVPQVCTLLGSGIYAAYAIAQDKRYPAVANIGTRPTFGEGSPTVEVHLLDFAGELQGEWVRVQFVERLRDERRFGSAKALRAQVAKDIIKAREILE